MYRAVWIWSNESCFLILPRDSLVDLYPTRRFLWTCLTFEWMKKSPPSQTWWSRWVIVSVLLSLFQEIPKYGSSPSFDSPRPAFSWYRVTWDGTSPYYRFLSTLAVTRDEIDSPWQCTAHPISRLKSGCIVSNKIRHHYRSKYALLSLK